MSKVDTSRTRAHHPTVQRQPASRQPASRQPASRQPTSRQPTSRQPASRQPSSRPAAPPRKRAPSTASAPPRRRPPPAAKPTMQRRGPARIRRAGRFKAGDSSRRLLILFAVSALLFVGILARVIILQTSQAGELKAAGLDQRTTVLTLRAGRGSILDRNGQELALSVPMTTISANPKHVVDPAGTVALLASVVELSAEKQQSLIDSFTTKAKSFVYVARQVDDATAVRVDALNLPGVDTTQEDRRVMPSGQVGLSVIGRTNIDGGGTAGIEKQFDLLLTGLDGKQTREHGIHGETLPGAGRTTVEPVAGADIMLTIHRPLQFEVEQALLAQVIALSAKSGRVIVMDTDTGDVLAEANVQRNDSGEVQVTSANLAVVEANEPGSTIKAFSVASAMNEGVLNPDTTIEVPDVYVFDKGSEKWEKTIRDAESHPPMAMSVRDIVVRSSNIGTYLVTKPMSSETYESYLRKFGFGSKTALNFQGESRGLLSPAAEWYGSQQATVRFGYGLSVTSQQLVAAMNTIANHGTYVAPRLLLGTIDSGGVVSDAPDSERHEVVTRQTADAMTSVLRDVVCNEHGTGKLARLDGISVAGKTGTGYKIQDNGTYEGANGERAYFATFVGFLPADDPQITILVSIDEPDPTTRDRFGGTAAAPTFAKVAQAAIRSLGISPTPNDVGCGN